MNKYHNWSGTGLLLSPLIFIFYLYPHLTYLVLGAPLLVLLERAFFPQLGNNENKDFVDDYSPWNGSGQSYL